MATSRETPQAASTGVGPPAGSVEYKKKFGGPGTGPYDKSTQPKRGEKRKFPDGNTYVYDGGVWVLDLETKPDGMPQGAWQVLQAKRWMEKHKDLQEVFGAGLPEYTPPPGNPVTLAPVRPIVNLPGFRPGQAQPIQPPPTGTPYGG